MKCVIFSIILTGVSLISQTAANSPSVSTLVNAKWKQTPLYLEIAEYLATVDENLYWSFIKSLDESGKSLGEYGTDSQQYLTALNIAKLYVGASQMPLLKLVVSMHSLTPRIQAHFQSANEAIPNKFCQSDIFAVIESEVACSVNDIKSIIKKLLEHPQNHDKIETYNFDHIYPGSENNLLTVILYGDIGKREFFEFHKFIVAEVTQSKVRYVFRHYLHDVQSKNVRLSAYGVELHLKSTEYKSQDDSPKPSEGDLSENLLDEFEIHGLDFKMLQSRFPKSSHSLDQLKKSLIHSNNAVPQLKAWEFQDLGLKAAATIVEIQGDESLQILQYTSQNFPMHAKTLLSKTVSESLRSEVKHNTQVFGRSLNILPPDGSLFINGLFFDADSIDLENVLEIIRADMQVLDLFHKNHIQGNFASSLLTVDLSKTVDREFAIDIRDAAIFWINDIETDVHYRRWPGSVTDLLRPTFPGMLRNIRKNLFSLVIVVDPLEPKSRNLIKLAESFVTHLAPVRLGIVFDFRKSTPLNENDYRSVLCAFNYVSRKRSSREALNFFSDLLASLKSNTRIHEKHIKQYLRKKFTSILDSHSIFSEDSEYDFGRQLSIEFVNRLGLKGSPQALLNGVPMQQTFLDSDSEFEEAVFTEIMQQTSLFQKAVYRGDLTDSDYVIDYLMNQSHVMPRLNQRILGGDKPRFLDVNGVSHNDLSNVRKLVELSDRDMTATLASNLKYFKHKSSKNDINELHTLTLWIFADLSISKGKELLKNALLYLNSSSNARVAFIPNCEGAETLSKNNLNRIVWAYSQTGVEEKDIDMVLNWLETPPDIEDANKVVDEIYDLEDVHIKMLRVYAQRVLNLRNAERAVIGNAKIYGPLLEEEQFSFDDFHLIEHLSSMQYGDKIVSVFKENNGEKNSHINSDTLLKVYASLLMRQARPRFNIPEDVKEDYSVVKLNFKDELSPRFDILAVVDPASKAAQKLSPILILLRSILNCQMRIFLTPITQHSDMPVKNFYRYVLEPEVQFDSHGNLTDGKLTAKFTQLPINTLLTQNLNVPDNWLVEAVRSVYDLDNIKLSEIGGPVHSEFELEYLLLEGHCFDSTSGAPPRGLQITLGKKGQPALVDTIVMANLGYFQLKANPGAWELRLREGKSADIYEIISVEGPNTNHDGITTKIVISSLRSHVIKLRVSKKIDKHEEDLLDDSENSASNSGIWNSIANSFTGSSSSGDTDDTINIFSVASGHLYERLLRIMMVSLLKHTKSPVKFWFLKNYLSPQFTDFLPDMAREYKFEFELVQYKWPRWLHQQTEKQRTIWGYKILFLDVLFPLNVKKIIFVDADAIVRADIKELYELDLGNAPYAYTPFCDSRKEMEGFRFWKQGYWRSHLAGRRYHISALYVVDLKRFRKIAAGDRIRGQYQALSQDPNSLSNLDQDLPNNMIHQVSIKSLPEEWLWCETWCNDSSLKTAKVIDLCNNPLTKEAKLAAAQRIIPEWKSYDDEIKQLIKKIEDSENVEHENEVKLDSLKISKTHGKHIEL